MSENVTDQQALTATTGLTPTEGIAQSLVPYYVEGGKRVSYLSYLVAGFSVTEAETLAKVHHKSVLRWRAEDAQFRAIEQACQTILKDELSTKLMDIEFTRNFRLIMAKDFKILFKDATGGFLNAYETEYLNNIRKFYTPQHLAMVKQMVAGKDINSEAFDFTKTVMTIRLEKTEGRSSG